MASKLKSIHLPSQADEIFFVLPFTYTLDLWLIKYSLLAFYNRIFVQPQLRRYILVTAIILALTLLACFLYLLTRRS
jgi:hypothetical protein